MKSSFRQLRKLVHDSDFKFYETKTSFQNFLKLPDKEQSLITTFQKEFNSLDEEYRSDVSVKAELHKRVDVLRDELWEISDRRKDEAENERSKIGKSTWIQDHAKNLSQIITGMIQTESDRYFSTRQVILDYYKDLDGVLELESTRKKPVVLPIPEDFAPLLSGVGITQIDPTKEGETVNTVLESRLEDVKEDSKTPQEFDLENVENRCLDIDVTIQYLIRTLQTAEYSLDVAPDQLEGDLM